MAGGILIRNGNLVINSAGNFMTEYVAPAGPAYPTDGLVERWTFDSSTTGLNGKTFVSIAGTFTDTSTGLIGECLAISYYTGSGVTRPAYLKATDAGIISAISNGHAFSYSVWLRDRSVNGAVMIMAGDLSNHIEPMMGSWGGDATKLGFGIHNPGVDIYAARSDAAFFNKNIWQHAVGTFDGTTFKLYINSTLQSTTGSPGAVKITEDSGITIGEVALYNGNYAGEFDLLYIYNKALSQTEINQLYNGGSGV